MFAELHEWIRFYNDHIGPWVLLGVLIPAGLFYTIYLRFIQFRKFGTAVKIVSGRYDSDEDPGDISHFQALSAALSATVGIGNIAGVAMAIAWGGPGAAFWIWVTGFLGMALKYAECTLAVKYREKDDAGNVAGGPMYYIKNGMGPWAGRWAIAMAYVFAVSVVITSFGTGNMTQSNTMAEALRHTYGVPKWISGLVISSLVFLVIVGGIRRIGAVASRLVPFMALFYLAGATAVILMNLTRIDDAFWLIIRSAFTGEASLKGTVIGTMLWGIRRGLFSNEAGQGSAPIAHAAARTKYPVREGLVSMLEPFIDTVVICFMTSMVIILGGLYLQNDGTKPLLDAAALTTESFRVGLAPLGLGSLGQQIVTISTVLFALSTAISWSYYGDRGVQFLFGNRRAVFVYRVIFSVAVYVGAVQTVRFVWDFADMVITFMALPNLLALFILSRDVKKSTQDYFEQFPH